MATFELYFQKVSHTSIDEEEKMLRDLDGRSHVADLESCNVSTRYFDISDSLVNTCMGHKTSVDF